MKARYSGTSARLLELAAAFIAEVDTGHSTLDDCLDAAPAELRRTLGHLLLNFFRHRRFVDGLIASYASRPPKPEIKRVLEAALTQIFFQDAIAPESAVNIAVESVKPYRADGFVNALLRRAMRERPQIVCTPDEVLPGKLLNHWLPLFGPDAVDGMTAAFLTEPDFTFRMEYDYPVSFDCEAVESPGLFRFFRAPAETVLESEDFRTGRLYIQDPAASIAPSLGDFSRVITALDLCAAPGGKSLMLIERMPEDAVLAASDRSAGRQRLTARNFALRNLTRHKVITAEPRQLWGVFDSVLADVPCSNTGVFRRRPDALWRFSVAELEKICALQRMILSEAARLTAPGGQLIYSTCSIEPEENSLQVARFLEEHPDFMLVEQKTLLPDMSHDGAFAALLLRK